VRRSSVRFLRAPPCSPGKPLCFPTAQEGASEPRVRRWVDGLRSGFSAFCAAPCGKPVASLCPQNYVSRSRDAGKTRRERKPICRRRCSSRTCDKPYVNRAGSSFALAPADPRCAIAPTTASVGRSNVAHDLARCPGRRGRGTPPVRVGNHRRHRLGAAAARRSQLAEPHSRLSSSRFFAANSSWLRMSLWCRSARRSIAVKIASPETCPPALATLDADEASALAARALAPRSSVRRPARPASVSAASRRPRDR
jgi:hypothetical protein